MNWKKYKLTPTDGSAPSRVIESPSVGVAVEYYLAVHGMLRYDGFIVEEVEEEPDEKKKDVVKLFKEGELTNREVVKELDEYHIPNCEIVKRKGEEVK